MKRNKIKLTIPNDLIYLPVVLNAVRNMAEIMGFEQEDILQLEGGTEEAIANVIKYAFEDDEDATFDMIVEMHQLGLNIIIKEKGIPFDPSLVHKYSKETLKKDLEQKGLGTYLMKQFLDDVSFHNLGQEGKETCLFKHLNNKQIQDLISKEEMEVVESEKDQERLPKGSVKFIVRRMKPEEAVEVSKCAYSSYGYTYINENIYYPDRVRELNKTDTLISYVAVTETNEIIAHNALEREGDSMVPEKGVAFTKPKYRGQGCLRQLSITLMEEAKKRHFTGVFSKGITTHAYSQSNLIKFGFRACAVHISFGKERIYKGIDQQIKQRESVIIMFHFINPPLRHVLYVPSHHIEMIKLIYDNLGVEPEFRSAGNYVELPVEKANTMLKTNLKSMTAHITINQYGLNVVEDVRKNLKSLCQQRLETIYLHLSLNDKYTAWLTHEFEKLGFFFSGIIPGDKGNDELILQYLNNYVIDYDRIMIASEVGRKMMEYIRKRDPNQ